MRSLLATAAIAILALCVSGPRLTAEAQRLAQSPVAPKGPAAKPVAPAPAGTSAPPSQAERIEADVSTRSVAITSGFAGSEIIVFGSVDNSRQPSPEAGYYDVVVAVEGTPEPVIARRKSNVAGLWINTSSLKFDAIPSYYAIASTRPLDEIADDHVLRENAIGFHHVKLRPRGGRVPSTSEQEITNYKDAVIRLKQQDGLYITRDYGVVFIGRSLFRSSVTLPANVPVGPLTAKVYLFREGELLSRYSSKLTLEREGIERWLYEFAFGWPFLYGIFTVLMAISAGLAASAIFQRRSA